MTSALTTRIVGPWIPDIRDQVYHNLSTQVRARARKFRFGGSAYIELWPEGYALGDPRVHRAPLPNVPHLPTLFWLESANQSDRSEAISGIIIHETEGNYAGAVSWLATARSQVSAHLCVREDGQQATQLVAYSRKAWHAENANSHTIGIELAGMTATANNPQQLRNAARICAVLCSMYHIPVRMADAKGYGGITTHRALGEYGGGHHDPGGFAFSDFLADVIAESSKPLPRSYGRN